SIVANYLINALNLVQIGIMDSVYFPTVALVRDGQPMNPVRIYAGPKMDDRDQIVVFISEFQPPPNLIKGIAATVLDWAQDARCNLLVCPEGLIVDAREDEGDRQVEVYGIGSTDKAMDMIRKNGITVFEEGVITGVAGVLLNEGRKRDFDVITLLSEAHPDYPDARAAARAIEIIDKLLLHTELDARPLYVEVESRLRLELRFQGGGGFLSDAFRRLSSFGEGIRSEKAGVGLRPEDQRTSLPDCVRPAVHPLFDFYVRNAMEATECRMSHPLRDVLREVRDMCDTTNPLGSARFQIAEGRPGPRRLDDGVDHPAASWIVPTPQDLHVRVTSEGPQESQQNPTEVVDGRRPSHVRSSNEAHVNGS